MRKSFSQWAVFNTCEAQYDYRHNQKLPSPQSASAGRGELLHSAIEAFFKGEVDILPHEIEAYNRFFLGLRNNYKCQPEVEFAVAPDWTLTHWDDPDRLVRGKIDLRMVTGPKTTTLYDWKTGKMYDDHAQQMMLYACVESLFNPEIEQVEVICTYLDLKENKRTVWPREMIEGAKDIWSRRFKDMDSRETFMKRPGRHCAWCAYSKRKGGPCDF